MTGSSGLLGHKLVGLLEHKGFDIIALYRSKPPATCSECIKLQLDLTEPERLVDVVQEHKPDVVFHLAAFTNVDACEKEREMAWRVNTLSTIALVRASVRVGARIVYISTDYVFDGRRGQYREDDAPSPINYYGLTKLAGETPVLAANGVVVRTSGIYGSGPGKKTFPIVVIEKLGRGEEIHAAIDQWYSPTLNTLLARALLTLLEKLDEAVEHGVLHIAGSRVSRYEFALMIAEKFGLPKDLVKPVKLEELQFIAPRPRDSSLDVTLARQLVGSVPFWDHEAALEELRRELRQTG
ncbi:dTDP-4-dehydrorhamnose reductase [Pyrolobus fumarii 1A]|uniref:dTDP-4-dehydrorhamnose reductase n=1 Tax=Pyrolobus fumarii (strain DSM 11204 / 1A) TaxID=694429 RepID=G0EHH3_PYRF1|nr:dTDP-4-dehydrorhamnose reductase [Pyrolobus fumarii 1A]